jgi:hypothetical protein
MRHMVFAVAASAALGFAVPAQAGAPALAKDVATALPTASADLQLVRHGGRFCELGARGWHFHDRFGDRIACSPRPSGTYYIWREEGSRRGWYHRNLRRWY